MGDQEPDVNNHIYEEIYLASDDDNGIEDFDFPDNDTLYDGGFQIGENINPNLGELYIVTNKFNRTQIMHKTKITSLMKIQRLILISVKVLNSIQEIEIFTGKIKLFQNNFVFSMFKQDNHMLHMITFLLVAPYIGPRLFQTISNQKLHQNLIHMNLVLMSDLEEYKKRKMGLLQSDIFYAIGKILWTFSIKKTQRRKDLFRRNCKAKVVLEIIFGTLRYVVSDFVEQHNHELFSKSNMYLSCSKRKLDYSQEIFIHNLLKQNIGPVKAHRLYSALQVGPSVRGVLVSDFKNARRNLNCYIGGRDAKFLVDKINDRTKNVPSFTFEYKVLNKRLNALFWADEIAKYNYHSFRDVLSLDATFSMNKYDMVFVPFTGIDNHKKCVTCGARLLSKEDGVSYEWLLRTFLKAFRKQPQLVIADQDPALKKTIDKVFPLAHHRLYMWHITKKLPNKVQKDISRAGDNCFQKNVISSNGVDTMIVLEKNNITTRQTNDVDVDNKDEEYNYDCLIRDTEYMVTHSTKDGSFKCTCMYFEHVGILCRHIFCVFKFYGVEQFPEKYILTCWRRDVIPTQLLKRRVNSSFDDSNSDMTAIDIFSTVDHCVSFLSHDAAKLKLYLDEQNKLKKKSAEQFKKLLGVVCLDVVSDVSDIQNLTDIHNKGSVFTFITSDDDIYKLDLRSKMSK
uniref:SWIM-type domain-containing protein n=1 Tax=Lactuca sativa TaxID=4236 RepID=A0A9R1W1K0_LACSA|nr:hypothetical protein LSAT_V11C300104050 [Lactuca sativa]